jgi:hypothetical protein
MGFPFPQSAALWATPFCSLKHWCFPEMSFRSRNPERWPNASKFLKFSGCFRNHLLFLEGIVGVAEKKIEHLGV